MMNKELRNKNQHPAPSITSRSPAKAGTRQQATWYLLAFFFIMTFAYFFWTGSYILFFQEQQSLFLYTSPYLSDFLLKPGGFLDLSGKFLTQFYISRFAGSVILSLILTLPGIILLHINKRVLPGSALSDLLLLIPSCLLLLMQAHYYHLIMYNIGFLLVLFYFLITILSEKKKVRYLALAFFPLFYYLAGAYASIFICIYIIYCLVYVKSPQKYYYPSVLIGVALISVFVFNKIFLLQSIKQLFLYPLPFINDPTHKVLFYAISGYIILYPVLYRLTGSVTLKKINTWLVSSIPAVIVLCVTVTMLIAGYNSQTARVINLERLVFDEKWNEAVEYQEKYPSENLIGQYFYNIALAESDQLCDRLFHGRQDFGTGSLFLEWSSDHINWGANSFYAIGLINEAQRWAYEEMVVYGPRPQNMKILIKASLIYGKYKMTGKYTRILKNTLFYRTWAKEYEKLIGDSLGIQSHPELGRKVKILPGIDFFIFLESPQNNLPMLVDENPANREAFEYLMSWLMLSKEVEMLVNNIRLMKNMGYTRIPRHIEEAVMLYYNSKGVYPDLGGLELSDEIKLRFSQYFTAYMSARQNPASLKEKMEKQFSNTFWYYFHFK